MATQRIRTNRVKRHKLITALAVGLGAASMAVPAVAAGRTDAGTTTSGPTMSTTLHRDGSKATPFVANVSPTATLHRDGSKAVPLVANLNPTAAPADSGTGFDWGDAMIGAGGAVALIAVLGAGGLTIRSRRHVEPAATAQG
jgi:hypothetical protein